MPRCFSPKCNEIENHQFPKNEKKKTVVENFSHQKKKSDLGRNSRLFRNHFRIYLKVSMETGNNVVSNFLKNVTLL